MSKKIDTLTIRTSSKLIELFREMSNENNCSIAHVLRGIINVGIKNLNASDFHKELKLLITKEHKKELNSQLYIVKNMYKRVLDMAMSFYFTTGNINMRAINVCIDLFVDEFENFDDKVKTAIATDFKLTVKRLRNQNFLLQQSDTVRKLKLIEKR